ncbi:MAG: diguanylate cyclase [Candidatus Acidulodesulfobacterium sp.]
MSEIKYSVKYRPKMSIRAKLIMSFSLSVLIPLFLLAVANTYIFKNQTKKENLNKVRITLSGAQRIYYSQAKRLKNAFLISSYNPYLIKAVIHKNILFQNSLIKSYKKAFNFADYIAITDDKGYITSSTGVKKGFKPSLGGMIFEAFRTGFPIVKTAIIRKSTLIGMGVKLSNGTSNMFLVTVVPFIHDGRPAGSIFGLISLNNNGYLPETIYNEYHLKTAVFASLFNRQVCLSTLKIPGNIFGIGSRLPENIHDKIMSGKDFIKELNYNGETVFAAFHPIKNIKGRTIGSIAVFISNRRYETLFRKTAEYAIFIIFIGLLISFVISYFASKDTLNPISALRSAINEFTSGDLNTKLIIDTKDEFESIGKGFTEMAATVKDREERMEKYNLFSDFLVGSLDFDKIISSTLNILEELLNISSGIIYIYSKSGKFKAGDSESAKQKDNKDKSDLNNGNSGADDDLTLESAEEGYLIPYQFYGIRKFIANKINASEGMAGHCLKDRKTIWFRDIPENAMILKEKLMEREGEGMAIDYGFCEVFPKDIVWLPLYIGGLNVGVLMVSSIYGFKKEDIAFLEHAVKELSVSLDNARIHRKVNELSITDELTGLYNRRKMDEVIGLEFNKAKRYGNSLSVMILDIDHFKRINDFYGHKTGDIVLSKIGGILKRNIRTIDTAVRYGGEEFVIILPQTDFNGAVISAKKIKNLIRKQNFTQINGEVTVSIGIASLPDDQINTVDDILKIADDFLYEAKNSGRNRIMGEQGGKKFEITDDEQ